MDKMYYQQNQFYLSAQELRSNLAHCANCTQIITPQNKGEFACSCGFKISAADIGNLPKSWVAVFAQEQRNAGAIHSLANAIDFLAEVGEEGYADKLAEISASLLPAGSACEVPRVASILKEAEERATLHSSPAVQKLAARIGLLRHQLEVLPS